MEKNRTASFRRKFQSSRLGKNFSNVFTRKEIIVLEKKKKKTNSRLARRSASLKMRAKMDEIYIF